MSEVKIAAESVNLDTLTISGIYVPTALEVSHDPGLVLADERSRRPLTEAEASTYVAMGNTASSLLVEVVTPLPDILAAVEYARAQTDEDGYRMANQRLEAAGRAVNGEYVMRLPSKQDTILATTNLQNGKAVGLHVDNRDRLPLQNRQHSRRRMVVNAGPGDRELIVCLPDILSLEMPVDYSDRSGLTDALRSVLADKPEQFDCLWIPVPAGQAYIAPTDLVGHMGSTLGSADGSTIFGWLGHWPRGSFMPYARSM
jgi:hypothetical protein